MARKFLVNTENARAWLENILEYKVSKATYLEENKNWLSTAENRSSRFSEILI